jgi:hypothetical protein
MSTVTCTSGVCSGTCKPGFADCDGNKQTNGCEIQLGTTTNCSACGDDCTNAANGHICYMNTMCGCAMDTDCLSGHTCNMGNHRCN